MPESEKDANQRKLKELKDGFEDDIEELKQFFNRQLAEKDRKLGRLERQVEELQRQVNALATQIRRYYA